MKAVALAVCATLSFAATTTTWEMNGYQDFLRGRLSGLSLTRDGRLILGPKLDTLFSSDQPEIWSVAQGSDGSLYLGTGHRGRVYKVDPSGNSTLIWTADQSEIFAVAVDAKGVVYAGTSPDGKVYRIENGKATEYFAPAARYIWALKFSPDGALFVATGDQGKIFRVASAGRGEVYYETGQSHVTCLAFDREGRLLAGSEPNGIIYRVTGPNKAFVLYDANLPEIRAIVTASDGAIYAAALGGSVARRVSAAPNSNPTSTPGLLTAPPISITVTDAQAGLNPAPAPEAPKPAAAAAPSAVTAVTTTENTGVERSALYKINPDNAVETLWSSKEENAYDLVFSSGDLLFITDVQGRIYRLDRERKTALVAQANEGEATRLLESANGLIAATGNLGKILRLGTGPGAGGWFESPVHDAGTVARWGRLSWRGASPGVAFRTRAGNSARPDPTWSDWSEPVTDLARSQIASPNAGYIQWRAEFSSGSAAAGIDNVSIAFLSQNTPPNVRRIHVSAQTQGTAKSCNAAASATSAYSVTVTDTADSSGTASQTISQAPDGRCRSPGWPTILMATALFTTSISAARDESQWKLLHDNTTDNYTLESDVLADGRFFFRVTRRTAFKSAESAREAELTRSRGDRQHGPW
jgi:WD40 repeat protein